MAPDQRRTASRSAVASPRPSSALAAIQRASSTSSAPPPQSPEQRPRRDNPGYRSVCPHRKAVDAGAADDHGRIGLVGSGTQQGEQIVGDDEGASPPRSGGQEVRHCDLLIGKVDRGEVAAGMDDLVSEDTGLFKSSGHGGVDHPRRTVRSHLVLGAAWPAMSADHVTVIEPDDGGVGLASAAVHRDDDTWQAPGRRQAHGRNFRFREMRLSARRVACSHWPTRGWASSAATTRSRPPIMAASRASAS